jgi:uncharacterized membrane protein
MSAPDLYMAALRREPTYRRALWMLRVQPLLIIAFLVTLLGKHPVLSPVLVGCGLIWAVLTKVALNRAGIGDGMFSRRLVAEGYGPDVFLDVIWRRPRKPVPPAAPPEATGDGWLDMGGGMQRRED